MAIKTFFCSLVLAVTILSGFTPGFARVADQVVPLAFIQEPENVVIEKGLPLTLNCSAHSPSGLDVQISWRHNGEKVVPDKRRINLLRNGSLYFSRVISRRKGRVSDAGYYECLAQNKLGRIVSRRIKLIIPSMGRFVKDPESVTVGEGGVARFECQINAFPAPNITWEKDGAQLPQQNKRFTVLTSGVLQITDVKTFDAGVYTCLATNLANQRRSAEASLAVIPGLQKSLPPKIVAASANVTRLEHDTVELECLAKGWPVPTVVWTREIVAPTRTAMQRDDDDNESAVRGEYFGNGNLRIIDALRDDAGTYVCTAYSGPEGEEKTDVARTKLNILVAPTFLEKPKNSAVKTAKTLRFHCEADGVPKPTISWLRNAKAVKIRGRIRVGHNNDLIVTQSVNSDSGIYQCVAENQLGRITATALGHVLVSPNQPDPPSRLRAETVSSTAINISFDPSPVKNDLAIIAYSLHYAPTEGGEEGQVVSDSTTLQAKDLQPFTNYTFYAVAYNERQASDHSAFVTAVTDEDVPKAGPSVTLATIDPTTLEISWEKLEPELARGQIVQYKVEYREHGGATINPLLIYNGDVTRYVLKDLQPKKVYDVRVIAGTNKGFPELADKVPPNVHLPWMSQQMPDWNASSIPSPSLQLVQLNATTVQVMWEMTLDSNISGYKLFWNLQNGPEDGPVILPADTSQYILTGLKPTSFYQVHLLAYNEHVDGLSKVKGIHLETKHDTMWSIYAKNLAPVEPPSKITCDKDGITPTSIRLLWKKPLSIRNITTYTVRYNEALSRNASHTKYVNTSNLAVVINALKPSTKYEFAVRSYDDRNQRGPFSNQSECWTLEDVPSKPLAVNCWRNMATSLWVSWLPPENPNGLVLSYRVLYSTDPTLPLDAWSNKSVDASSQEFENRELLLTNLTVGEHYHIRVQASTGVGYGPLSDEVDVNMGDPDPSGNSNGKPPAWELKRRKISTKNIAIIVAVAVSGLLIAVCLSVLLFQSKQRCCRNNPGNAAGLDPTNKQVTHMNGRKILINGDIPSGTEAHEMEVLMPMLTSVPDPDHDTKGGNNQVIRNLHKSSPNGILPHTGHQPNGHPPGAHRNPNKREAKSNPSPPRHAYVDVDVAADEPPDPGWNRPVEESLHNAADCSTADVTHLTDVSATPSDHTGSSLLNTEGTTTSQYGNPDVSLHSEHGLHCEPPDTVV